MDLPTPAQLRAYELEHGGRLPPAFYTLIGPAGALLQRRFPRARFVLTREALRAARRDQVPTHLFPFLVDPQPAHLDYYCFDTSTAQLGVALFAVHTVVEAWRDLPEWLRWVERPPDVV